jgi:UDP-N-acetylmuramoyl-tripeptide--D-alanyl-D-alanine ligase
MELKAGEILRAVEGQLVQGAPQHLLRGVSTDSRAIQEGELFIALKGDRFDGHHFINEVLDRNASGLIVGKGFPLRDLPSLKKDIPVIQVIDTLRALGDLASFWMQQNRATVVAITGSNGKTTTREMAATILEHSHRVLKPEHNWNNLIGLPLTLLRIKPYHQIALVEMGMNRAGEIKRLSQIAKPHTGLITNIGPAHLQYLKTLQNIARAKGELFESLTSANYAVVNTDDPLTVGLSKLCPARKVTFGINSQAQVTATDITPSYHSINSFTLKIEGENISVDLKTPGLHNVYNALAAASIATIFKLNLEEIKAGLERFTAFPGRTEIITVGNNINIINDTYNANPRSMEVALRTLVQLKGNGRVIAVLGDMLELGEASTDLHQQLGSLIKALNLDAVFLMGPHAAAVAESAINKGISEEAIHIGKTHEQIAKQLDEKVKEDDWILFKGSRGMKIEQILEQFLQMRNNASKVPSTSEAVTVGCNH